MKKVLSLCILAAFLVAFAAADSYLHHPRGSNNRFRGGNNNQRRLFNSQNNAKGGYNVGELNADDSDAQFQPGHLVYFSGSKLRVEWTNQHSCGPNSNAKCEFVLQYMCDDGLKTYNGRQWALKDTDANGNDLHEPPAYKTKCSTRGRNRGLFIADQNVAASANAQATRQNPGATEYGNECQEERDYYPYWHPSPWKDIAVFASETSRCAYYQAESMNVKPKQECECTAWNTGGCQNAAQQSCWRNNNAASCGAATGCTWATKTFSNIFQHPTTPSAYAAEDTIPAPECVVTPVTRDNHLGNSIDGETPHYWWTIPDTSKACGSTNNKCTCTFRVRYNMSSTDLDHLQQWQLPEGVSVSNFPADYFFVDYRINGQKVVRMSDGNFFGDNARLNLGVGDVLQIGHNTDQVSRVFQDRSHLFEIRPMPANYAGRNVWNVGVRGKRGNIVQTYPSTEYDMAPNNLQIAAGDCIHFQWTGSNSNPANDGNGKAGSDRSNFLMIDDLLHNFPSNEADALSSNFFPAATRAGSDVLSNIRYFATGGFCSTTTGCSGMNTDLNQISPTFFGHAMDVIAGYTPGADPDTAGVHSAPKFICPPAGTYNYISTRNNNFSNRSQKGTIAVVAA